MQPCSLCKSLPLNTVFVSLRDAASSFPDGSKSRIALPLMGLAHGVQVLHDMIMPHTDSGAAVGDAIASFGAVAVLAPRGRFEIELYSSFMKLLGQVRQRL